MLEDVRAFLAGRAVRARGPSLAYRGGKFARRHWIGILFALTLTAVTGGLLRHAQREARERESAEQVLRLMMDLFQVSDPDHPAGRVAGAREMLERTVPRLRSELASQPAVLADVLEMAGRVYGQLGDLDRASRLLEDALAERRRAGRGAAHSLLHLSRLRLAQGRVEEAASMAREGVRAAGGDRLLGASCALALAEACDRQGRAEAENWYREALRVREGILPAGHPQRATAMAGLGRWLVGHGRADEGERLLDEAFR
jgi:serine/threonine-protein kinase